MRPRDAEPDLGDPSFYLNRELSRLSFNRRVLAQARNVGHPLRDRVRFLAIAAGNLDEFYMVPLTSILREHRAGVVAVSEPAFWAGFDRSSASSFADYFRHLLDVEPKRAARYGIDHYAWLCINAKEAENVQLSREVIAMIPEFLDRPNVLGIGEIGLNKNTRNEATVFQEHVDLAVRHDELILIHTPHLEDKYKGTRMIVNAETVGPDDTVFDPLVHRAHWADCPHKADWRKNKR